MAEPKRRVYPIKGSFGNQAPPNTIPFPKQANMTAVELLAFFPNSINCSDVIYRMISNGGTRKSIHAIVNTHRDLETEWSANCCGEAMYKAMDRAGYADWTIKKHSLWHDSRKELWDGSRLDVGDLRTFTAGGPAGTMSFRRLADNMRTMPQGDDALDLTRMVQYCVQNAEDGWRYPKDYEELLELLGGPVAVSRENTDDAVFHRWENRKPQPRLPKSAQPLRGNDLFDGCNKIERSTTTRGRHMRRRTESRRLGSSVASGESEQMYAENAGNVAVVDDSESDDAYRIPYARALAEYVPPPYRNEATPSSSSFSNTRQAEFAESSDPYNAYAFRGPRRTPPYRLLGQIGQPDPWDTSGWAENLRWAFEQRVLFAKEHLEAAWWNESPEHMACIERERTQRVWASDELVEQLLVD